MLVIKDLGAVPEELWQYPGVPGSPNVFAPNWNALYSAIEKHYQGNEAPVPSLQEVVNWCCSNLRIACYDDQTKQPLVNAWSMGLPVVLPGCCGKTGK